jgi:hypothetical protein
VWAFCHDDTLQPMTRVGIALFGVLLVLQTGCPNGEKGAKSGPPAACSVKAAQCSLAPGVLGVCNDAPCQPDQAPPCLACVSQH